MRSDLKILGRIRGGFTYAGVSGKEDHRLDAVALDYPAHHGGVLNRAFVRRTKPKRKAVPGHEVVERHRFLTGRLQQLRCVTTYTAGTTGDQNG